MEAVLLCADDGRLVKNPQIIEGASLASSLRACLHYVTLHVIS